MHRYRVICEHNAHTGNGEFDSSCTLMGGGQSKGCYCICSREIRNYNFVLKHFVQAFVLAFNGTVS